jgi:hypothetical protein
MAATNAPRDEPSGPAVKETPSEPRVTLGFLMLATVVIPAVSVQSLGPETAAKMMTAMIPVLLVAIFRTSISSATVFETDKDRQ